MSDPIYANYKPIQRELPPKGPANCVVFRVFDIGLQPNLMGDPANKVIVYFETPFRFSKGDFMGKRMMANIQYRISLGPKSYMKRDWERILGRPLTGEEMDIKSPKRLDLRIIEGMACTVSITHAVKETGTWPNIEAVLAPIAGVEPLKRETPLDFIPPYVKILLDKRIADEHSVENVHREPTKEETDIF